jgi:hypothetical protein
MKITKEEFDSLFSDDISKKKYDDIIHRIDVRVKEVWKNILKLQGRKLDWYDYDNGCGRDNNGDPIDGSFDPISYKENITFSGEWSGRDYDMPYNDYIPTNFLWEDYEEKVLKDIQAYKDNEIAEKIKVAAKRLELKEHRKAIIESIKSKLTKEELRFIKFKSN